MTAPAFWMVCRSPRGPGARTEPKQRFSIEADAAAAAQRLADETGHPHCLLAATRTIWPRGQTDKLL